MEQASSASSISLLRELCVPLVTEDMLGSMLLLDPLVSDLHLASATVSSLRSGLHSETIQKRRRARENDRAVLSFRCPLSSLISAWMCSVQMPFFSLSLWNTFLIYMNTFRGKTHPHWITLNGINRCLAPFILRGARMSYYDENFNLKEKSMSAALKSLV